MSLNRRMAFHRRTSICAFAALALASLFGPMGGTARAADKLSVAVIPIGDCAPIYIGISKGFFAKQNLEIELSTAGGGAAWIVGTTNRANVVAASSLCITPEPPKARHHRNGRTRPCVGRVSTT